MALSHPEHQERHEPQTNTSTITDGGGIGFVSPEEIDGHGHTGGPVSEPGFVASTTEVTRSTEGGAEGVTTPTEAGHDGNHDEGPAASADQGRTNEVTARTSFYSPMTGAQGIIPTDRVPTSGPARAAEQPKSRKILFGGIAAGIGAVFLATGLMLSRDNTPEATLLDDTRSDEQDLGADELESEGFGLGESTGSTTPTTAVSGDTQPSASQTEETPIAEAEQPITETPTATQPTEGDMSHVREADIPIDWRDIDPSLVTLEEAEQMSLQDQVALCFRLGLLPAAPDIHLEVPEYASLHRFNTITEAILKKQPIFALCGEHVNTGGYEIIRDMALSEVPVDLPDMGFHQNASFQSLGDMEISNSDTPVPAWRYFYTDEATGKSYQETYLQVTVGVDGQAMTAWVRFVSGPASN